MDQDMEGERMRQEMLLYYIDGKVYNREHDRQFLDSLARMRYLEWDMAAVPGGQYRTTVLGLLYLKIRGYDVPIPEFRNGRIVRKDERIRMVDWDPSLLKGSDQNGKVSVSRPRSGWFKRNIHKGSEELRGHNHGR